MPISMRVLVTGANGFVGHVLCTTLTQQGYAVRGAVRSNPHAIATKVPCVAVGDITEKTDWSVALMDVDVLIHLAARVHVMKDFAADPLAEFLKVNLHGTVNLAQQAAQASVKRLVYVSSVKVNGEATADLQSFTESDRAAPQDPYGISKWQAEQALHRIARETGLEIVIVRPPLVYGPGVKGNFMRLLAAIDREIPLPLAGANNLRSLLYVGNLVDALITCAIHPAATGQAYLVSDGEDISTAMLVEKIARALERKSRSFYFPPDILRAVASGLGRAEQVDRLFGSLRVSDEKIRNELGSVPPYTLEQGLHATAEWYRARRNLS
jgi:nucleoside-diphosphate-sugar epimerase